jgi:hypothetical protein
MIGFMLEEGALTVGAMSGLFTTSLLNSLKVNIIDPAGEQIIPSSTLINIPDNKSKFGDMFPIPTGPVHSTPIPVGSTEIKWKVFLKDFVIWLVLMFCLYLFWKYVLIPLRPVRKVV